jgi:hypothetical protein
MTDPSPEFGGARPVAADVAGLPGSTRREPLLLGLEFASTRGGGAEQS